MNTIRKFGLLATVPLFTVWLTDRPITSLPVSVSVSVSVSVVVPVLVPVVDPVLVSVSVTTGDVVSVVDGSVAGPVVVVGSVVVGGGAVVVIWSVVGSVVGGFVDVGTVPDVVVSVDVPDSESASVPPTKSSPQPATRTPTTTATGPHLCAVRLIVYALPLLIHAPARASR